ncbi:MAG: hypothetical protein ABIH42_10070 [Planctomycetota bacterium]
MKLRLIIIPVLLYITTIVSSSIAQDAKEPAEETISRKITVSVCGECGYWEPGNVPLKCSKCNASRDKFKKDEKEITLGTELVKNGTLEAGADSPDNWDEIDNLTTFWGKRDENNKCFKFDSDILEEEAEKRRSEMKLPKNNRPSPTKKTTPPEKQKYETIAALEGALIWSDFINIEAGKSYYLSCEVKTAAPAVKIWVKGYRSEITGREKVDITYKKYFPTEDFFSKDKLNKWVTVEGDFTPQHPNPTMIPQKIKIMVMVYWPRGEAFLDNFSIREIITK